MIQVSGYFYDVDAQVKLDTMNVTIASTSILSPDDDNVIGIQVTSGSTFDDYATVSHISTSPYGNVNPSYNLFIELLGIPIPVIGRINSSNFVYDDNNILSWFKLYYDVIKRRADSAGENPHTIRFCRGEDHDIYYIEYNPFLYGENILLKNEEGVHSIDNIFDGGYLYVYSNDVSGLKDYKNFYLGCVSFDSNGAVVRLTKSTEISEPIFTVNDDSYITNVPGELGTLNVTEPPNTIRYITKTTDKRVIYLVMEHFYVSSEFPDQSIIAVLAPDGGFTAGEVYYETLPDGASGSSSLISFEHDNYMWLCSSGYGIPNEYYGGSYISNNHFYNCSGVDRITACQNVLSFLSATYIPGSNVNIRGPLYDYLIYTYEPASEITPTDIPPVDEPTDPSQPDIQDPYYDPTSDPKSPQYDPTKDPKSPSYDPSVPHTPYRPISQPEHHEPPVQTPQDDIDLPPVPPSYITNNKMFTLYNPSGGDLNNVATFLWSSGWSVDAFKKIFANPIECILGLMVLPQLSATVSTKELTFGNIPSGINLHYFDSQFFDFDCGSFDVKEYYASYLDYAPYTKISIFLPFIGDHELDVDEVMNKTISVKYRFDLASGDCVAFIFVGSSIHYQFSGNCAARLPIGASSSNALSSLFSLFSMAASVPAGLPALGAASAIAVTSMKQKISHSGSISGSAGLMGVLTPYLIVTRPRQAYPMNQNIYTGYPAFITESLSQLTGYTEVEQVHLEHIPATGEELVELERLLKEGVLF